MTAAAAAAPDVAKMTEALEKALKGERRREDGCRGGWLWGWHTHTHTHLH